jgi:hypothetical protein
MVAQRAFAATGRSVTTVTRMRPHPALFARLGAGALATAALAACSGGGSHPTSNSHRGDTKAACAQLARLESHAGALAQVDVADPDAFNTALDRAVDDYVADLRKLRKVAPDSLRPAIDDVRHAVVTHQFANGEAARAQLSTYEADHCTAPPTTRVGA